MIVARLAVSQHGHNVRKRCPRAIVLVGINENPKALESICGPEDGALDTALLRQPNSHTIAVEVVGAMDLKLDFHLGRN